MEYCPKLMSTLLPIIIILLYTNFLPSKIQASPLIMWKYVCTNSSGSYEEFSMYQENLNVIISSIASSTQLKGGFYNVSVGDGDDKLDAIGICRGDSDDSLCLTCLEDAVYKLPQKCPTQKEAICWYDDCMLRYSPRDIFHKMETSPNTCLSSVTQKAADPNLLNQTRGELLQRLKLQAVANKGSALSVPYLSMGELYSKDIDLTVYAMVQCTPDINMSACSNCLDAAIQQLTSCSYTYLGGRVLMPSCGVRYETHSFFNVTLPGIPARPPQPPSPSTDPPNKTGNKGKVSKYVIAAVVPTVVILALFAFLFCFFRRRKTRMSTQPRGDISSTDNLQYDFSTIKAVTDNFSSKNMLGQGGFGAVYKGKLPDGREIAVKRLKSNSSGQGEAEFKNEILLLAKLQHRNLVRLLGYCLAKEERLLIYEFVPNSSLDHFLFGTKKEESLDWEKRTKIINGIAKGVLYLHEDSRLRIIHRDLKASNILLDEEMIPKIADFGLAKLFLADQTHADTSRVAGTYGYMAPEYIIHGLFSVKADVYSFGILLLEIICGRRNRDVGENAISLTSLVWKSWKDGTILTMVDPKLSARDDIGSEVRRYVHIGLLCVQENEIERPIMSKVVLMLSTDSISLPFPSTPGFMSNTIPPGDYNNDQSYSRTTAETSNVNEDSFTELYAR